MSPADPSVPDGRTFTSTLLLIVGPAAAALDWLAFNDVGAATVLTGWGATVIGALLRPSWRRAAFAVLGLFFGCWPFVVAGLFGS
ncbi:MAG: hypothetical protein U0446_08570 [Dehalococcoidia bacterium]